MKNTKRKTKSMVLNVCNSALTNCNAIEFLQACIVGYPLLHKIASNLTSAPASQPCTECLFNVCDLTAVKRNRLTKGLGRHV